MEAGGVEAINEFSPTFANMRFRPVFIDDSAHLENRPLRPNRARKRTKTKFYCPELSRTFLDVGVENLAGTS